MNINASPGGSPRYPLVAALLVGVVAALLVGGWFASQHFRGQVGTEPARSVAAPSPRTTAPADVAVPAAVTAASPAAVTSVAASPAPSFRVASSPLEREIEQAYLHYWDVRAAAYLNLDTSHLAEVMAGAELERMSQQIKDLQAKGRAVKVDIDHRYLFASESPDKAVIYDEYLNRSLFVDVATNQVLPTSSPAVTEKISYELQKIDGSWKVIDGAQHT